MESEVWNIRTEHNAKKKLSWDHTPEDTKKHISTFFVASSPFRNEYMSAFGVFSNAVEIRVKVFCLEQFVEDFNSGKTPLTASPNPLEPQESLLLFEESDLEKPKFTFEYY